MYKVASHLLAASVARYSGQFAIFILLARMLGPHEAGSYSLALAITAPVFIVAGLGMRTVFLTLYARIAVSHYERLRATTALLAVLISIGIALVIRSDMFLIVVAVACGKALDSFNDLYGAVLQKDSRAWLTIVTSLAISVLQVAGLAVALLLGGSIEVALGVSVVMYAIVIVTVVRPITIHNRPKEPLGTRKRPWREIVSVGLPTGLSLGLVTILSTMPQYYLGWFSGPADVGRYATLLYLVVAAELMLNALSQSWIPRGRQLDESARLTRVRVLDNALRWTLITAPVAALGIAAIYIAFPIVLGDTYRVSIQEVVPLAISILITPTVFASATALAVQNRYRWALVVSSIAMVCGLAAGLVLVPEFGVAGALWTYAICLAIRAAGGFLFARPSRPSFTGSNVEMEYQ